MILLQAHSQLLIEAQVNYIYISTTAQCNLFSAYDSNCCFNFLGSNYDHKGTIFSFHFSRGFFSVFGNCHKMLFKPICFFMVVPAPNMKTKQIVAAVFKSDGPFLSEWALLH